MSLAARFFALFQGLDRAHGVYREKGRNRRGKMEGEAITVASPPTVELWERHLAGRRGLGIVPIRQDARVVFGAIDIDINDINHVYLEEKVRRLNLPLIACRSKSGGAHLYIFFSEPASAAFVRGRLDEFATALGFPGVEVFPKQSELSSDKDVGNWINMPYFGETRHAMIEGQWAAPETFLDLAQAKALTESELEAIEPPPPAGLEEGPPCLQGMAGYGFPEGGRNSALFNLGIYCQLRYPDTWEQELQHLHTALFTSPLSANEVSVCVRSLKRKEYFYQCDRSPLREHCSKELCRGREFGIGFGGNELPLLPTGLQKLKYHPPRWIVCIEGHNVEVDTQTLIDQRRYLRMVMEELNKLPPAAKPADWRKAIARLLEEVEEVEVPYDASEYGQFMHHVERFITTKKRHAKHKEEITMGKVWIEEGRAYFRSSDLQRFFDSSHFKISGRQMWSWLRNMGAGHRQLHLRGLCVQCWFMKMPEIPEEEYPDDDRPEF